MQRREFVTFLAVVWSLASFPEQRTTKVPRIGFLALSQEGELLYQSA